MDLRVPKFVNFGGSGQEDFVHVNVICIYTKERVGSDPYTQSRVGSTIPKFTGKYVDN